MVTALTEAEKAAGFDLGAVFSDFGFEVAMIALVACVVIAFFAMRLYKIFMSLFGAVGVGYIVYTLIKPGAILAEFIPTLEKVNLASAIGLAAAIIGFILGVALPKFVLFLGGVGIGVVATKFAFPLIAPGVALDPTIMLIVGVVVGLILGVLLSLLFKPVYILLTSLGFSTIAGIIIIMLVMPSVGVLPGALSGLVLGIIPMIYQFRSSAFELN